MYWACGIEVEKGYINIGFIFEAAVAYLAHKSWQNLLPDFEPGQRKELHSKASEAAETPVVLFYVEQSVLTL